MKKTLALLYLNHLYRNPDFFTVETLFRKERKLFGDNIWAYYYDLTFEETLIRHRTKSNKDDFGKEEMLKWWNEKDFIEIIPEKIITQDISLTNTVEMIIRDIFA